MVIVFWEVDGITSGLHWKGQNNYWRIFGLLIGQCLVKKGIFFHQVDARVHICVVALNIYIESTLEIGVYLADEVNTIASEHYTYIWQLYYSFGI